MRSAIRCFKSTKVIIEAIACGVPVIALRMGWSLDAIDAMRTRLLVNYGNADAIADAIPDAIADVIPDAIADVILTILLDEKLARRMGELERLRVQENITWTAVADRNDSAYTQVLGDGIQHGEASPDVLTVVSQPAERSEQR